MANWAAQLPKQEYGIAPREHPGKTAIYCNLEVLIGLAHRDQDADLLVAAASAWTLLGYNPMWVAEPITGPMQHKFVEKALRGRNRAKIRNEGLGLVRALTALESVGLLTESGGVRARTAAWKGERVDG